MDFGKGPWIVGFHLFVQAREAAEVAEKKELSAMSSGVTGGPANPRDSKGFVLDSCGVGPQNPILSFR